MCRPSILGDRVLQRFPGHLVAHLACFGKANKVFSHNGRLADVVAVLGVLVGGSGGRGTGAVVEVREW